MKKLLFLFSALLLVTGLFAQDDFKILYGPYLQRMGENEATVLWVTNRDAVGWVEVAPDDSIHFYAQQRPQFFENINGRKAIGRLHRVRLTGLNKGTTYRYRIISREVTRNEDYYVQYGKSAGNDVCGGVPYRFTTFDESKPSISCTVINDIHGKNDLQKTLLGDVAGKKLDFVFFNGDMANHMSSEEQIAENFLKTAAETFAAETPFFYSRGNHETRGRFAYEFLDYFPTSTGQTYYTFRDGPAYFIVLDGGEDKPDSDIEYHNLGDYDRYREEEARWLKSVVESAAFKQAPFRIVLIHIAPVNDTWHGALEVKRLFVPILNGQGIDLMLCGHQHRHHYIPGGEAGSDFPILINANTHAVDLNVTGQQLNMTVRDDQQKTVKTLSLPRRK